MPLFATQLLIVALLFVLVRSLLLLFVVHGTRFVCNEWADTTVDITAGPCAPCMRWR